MGEDIEYEALAHYAAHLASVAALDAQGVVGLVTPELLATVLVPAHNLLRSVGWVYRQPQNVASFAVLTQAAHRLRPTPGQWADTHVTRYCN